MTAAQKAEVDRLRRILREHQVALTVAHRRIAAVRGMHQPDETGKACDSCGTTWPCKTARRLGELG